MRPRHQATLMQPLQSDLQIPNCKTQKNYAQRREKLQLQNRMDLGTKPKKTIHAAITMRFASRTLRENWADYARNDPNRTRRTHEVPFIAGCSHLTRKSTRFCAPASSPKQTPCNSHAAAITMRFAATHTHQCSHYNAIGIHTSQNTKGEPITLETIQPHPPHTRGTIHRQL